VNVYLWILRQKNSSAVSLFNNTEEVKVSIPCESRAVYRLARAVNRDGQRLYRCIRVQIRLVHACMDNAGQRVSNAANTSSPVARSFACFYCSFVNARGLRVIGSSEQVHVVDALAITGDEGRRSLR
jgi:hypothetical protein